MAAKRRTGSRLHQQLGIEPGRSRQRGRVLLSQQPGRPFDVVPRPYLWHSLASTPTRVSPPPTSFMTTTNSRWSPTMICPARSIPARFTWSSRKRSSSAKAPRTTIQPGKTSCRTPARATSGMRTNMMGTLGPNPAGLPPDPSCLPEFFGDTMLVNGAAYPYLEVEQRQYRFRMLNACKARFLNPRLVYADPNNPAEPRPASARTRHSPDRDRGRFPAAAGQGRRWQQPPPAAGARRTRRPGRRLQQSPGRLHPDPLQRCRVPPTRWAILPPIIIREIPSRPVRYQATDPTPARCCRSASKPAAAPADAPIRAARNTHPHRCLPGQPEFRAGPESAARGSGAAPDPE